MKSAAMLWTGGKDSALALYEAGYNGFDVRCLVTFAPPQAKFLAHPLGVIELQAEALSLPHHVLTVCAPFEAGYDAALRRLRDELDIHCVVSGDIAEVAGHPNWIRERCRPLGMQVYTPLWGRDRATLLHRLLELGMKVIFSAVDTRWLDVAWVGRQLDSRALAELKVIRKRNGLDLCGEEGEYHTLVTDGPQFARRIAVRSHTRRVADTLAYMGIRNSELV